VKEAYWRHCADEYEYSKPSDPISRVQKTRINLNVPVGTFHVEIVPEALIVATLHVRRRYSCLQGRLPLGCGGDDGEVDSNNTNFSPLHPPEPSGHSNLNGVTNHK
jgi:hypothetical protein